MPEPPVPGAGTGEPVPEPVPRSVPQSVPESAPVPVVACVGAVVHDAAGRLLLIRRGTEPGRGLWSVPGGRVERGESLVAAVEREVLEETGLPVRAGAVVGRVRIPGPGVVYDVADLACTLLDPTAVPVAGDDADEVTFAAAADLAHLSCTAGLLESLGSWGVLPR
ncbi:ADP-ribose pyrophosphatase YjhB, NUDIX family [Trujillonella endophytica]|uniref:ADP-ribose pyrophosphatase YjhB, NUDIX family n=1 Tax=Trujillonella endophytica TaxID=673521 RepID=A0A1H8RZB4_9ACTN|nr:ADP-ribose pyrophosphatase YjhB, NUDIX family [Trujillella endophytica]